MTAAHQVTSEIGYDLMHDHLDVILSLLKRPLSRQEVVERLGSPAVLDRMLRHGLIRAQGDELHAVSSVYEKTRQEGMVDFLEHYVLPALKPGLDDRGFASLENRTLVLPPGVKLSERLRPLYDELVAISDRPTRGVVSRLTVLIVGTSRLQNADVDDAGADVRALHHLQQASLERSTPAEKDRAVVDLFVCLADGDTYAAVLAALERFLGTFEGEAQRKGRPGNYHLTVASHWRSASADSSPAAQRAS